MVINRLLKQLSYLLGSNVVSACANFLSIIILANILSTSDFGIYTLLVAYMLLCVGVFTPQAWQGLIKFLAVEPRAIKPILSHTLKYDLVAASIGVICAVIIAPYYLNLVGIDSSYSLTLQIMCSYVFFNQVSTSIGILRFYEKFKLLAFQNVITSLTLLLVVCLGSFLSSELSFFLIGACISYIFGTLYLNVKAYQEFNQRTYSEATSIEFKVEPLVKFNIYAHLTSIVDLPVKQLDAILVGYLVSVEASGVFKVIKQIGTLTTKFTGPFTQVLYPELNKCLASQEFEKLIFIFWKFTKLLSMTIIPIAIILGVTSGFWFDKLFTETYNNYNVELTFYLIAHAISVSFLAVHPTFLSLGYVKNLLVITLLANTSLIILIYMLAPLYGLLGVVLAIFMQYVITIAFKLVPILSYFSKVSKESSE